MYSVAPTKRRSMDGQGHDFAGQKQTLHFLSPGTQVGLL
jgi:hypothetical protein